MILIGNASGTRTPPITGTIPVNATWDQYIPIVDETGARLDITDYEFELAFRCKSTSDTVDLRLSTVTGEILKTTDDDGDTLRVFAEPSDLSSIRKGNYHCTFAAKNTGTEQIWELASGNVSFVNDPAAFA